MKTNDMKWILFLKHAAFWMRNVKQPYNVWSYSVLTQLIRKIVIEKKKWKRPTVSHDSVTWLGLLIPSSISLYLKANKTNRAKQANKMNIHRVNKTTLTVMSKYYIIEKGPYANDDLRYIKSSDCLKYKDLCGLLFSLNSIKCWPVHKKKINWNWRSRIIS